MICNKCGRKLPDDSEFCQYCGEKIETVAETSSPVEPVAEDSQKIETLEGLPVKEALSAMGDKEANDVVNALLEFQAKTTVQAMEANSKEQPDNEGDADFGLVPEKPIYTHAIHLVNGQKDYLNSLYTINGEKISYNRRGSTRVEGIHGMIDIYDTFLPNGQPYKTVYVNMYGAATSTKAPMGFTFSKPKTISNGANFSKPISPVKPAEKSTKSPNELLLSITNLSAIILTAIAMFSVFVSMLTHTKRYSYNWDPTVTRFFVLLILGAFLGFAINSYVKKRSKLVFGLSPIPVLTFLITIAEGSIFKNSDADVCNAIWCTCTVLVLIVTSIPAIFAGSKTMMSNWYKSVSYREKCYERVAKIHDYLEKGIITQEEFEEAKKDILKHLK